VYDEVYVNEARADLPQQMTLIDQTTVEGEITVNGSEMIAALFSMTPYYWRTPRAAAQRLTALQTLTTEIAFDFKVYRK
jgi:23S rRNA (guanine745-N1)-methyltransferase